MNTDYLKFQASSIQQLLRRKLTQSGVLTDQLYPGSDTKIIIDLFSWTFDVLTYILNNNISDVLFSDTNLYQNMNRLVKLLSYKPDGFHSSQAQFTIQFTDNIIFQTSISKINIYIPKYSYITVGKTDSQGNQICYSFTDSFVFTAYRRLQADGIYKYQIITPDTWPVLHNGIYKKYIEVFIANGVENDTFIMSLLDLSSENKVYIDHMLFSVFVQYINQSGQTIYEQWKQTDSMVLYGNETSNIFQLRLNQDKKYVISFGDGVHGRIPAYGSSIHVIYFQSNGEQGIIDTGEFSSQSLNINIQGINTSQLFGMIYKNQQNFRKLYGNLFITNNIFTTQCTKLKFVNSSKSSSPKTFQDIESIRKNAPVQFRRGHRLVTSQDYQDYIKKNYGSVVHDVFTGNNSYYTSVFYSWLNRYGKLTRNIRMDYYKFADACDFNNIYIWMVSTNSSKLNSMNMKKIILDCNNIKCITAQLIPLNAIITKFIPFVDFPQDSPYSYKNSGKNIVQYIKNMKIRVYKKQNTIVSLQQIKQLINSIIVDYFKKQNQRIGAIINTAQILEKIYNLNYIKSIQTVNICSSFSSNILASSNGLSFAAWTTDFIQNKDFTTFNGSYKLQSFQFPQLMYTSLLDMIQVIDNTYDTTTAEL